LSFPTNEVETGSIVESASQGERRGLRRGGRGDAPVKSEGDKESASEIDEEREQFEERRQLREEDEERSTERTNCRARPNRKGRTVPI
jgi:hypothetical protein